MIELLRNCLHGSSIATFQKKEGANKVSIIKTSTSADGIKCLKNEIKGLEWYQTRRSPQTGKVRCNIVRCNSHYIKIEIDYLKGERANYNDGLVKNADIIARAIEHYCCIWPPNQNMGALHGDLSIDNVIYNPESIYFIDWEHFHAHCAPWGYDALYLIFETLWFGMKNRKVPSKKEIDIIIKNLKKLNIFESPLQQVKEFIGKNIDLWGSQLQNFPDKLPVPKFSDNQIAIIDNMIREKLKDEKILSN